MRVLTQPATLLVALLLLSACSSDGSGSASGAGGGGGAVAETIHGVEIPAEPEPLTSFYVCGCPGMIPLFIAVEQGLFEKYGIDLELVQISGSSTVAQTMIAGDAQIGHTGGSASFAATIEGAEQVAIATISEDLQITINTNADIKSVEDLRGKTVGVSQVGSLSDIGARVMLEEQGLTPDEDVTITGVGEDAEMLAALTTGAIDAAAFTPPFDITAADEGFPVLLDSNEDLTASDYWQEGLIANRSFIEENRNLVLRYLMAFLEGYRQFLDDPDLRAQIMANPDYGAEPNAEIARIVADRYAEAAPDYPLPREETVASTLTYSEIPGADEVDPADLIDTSLLEDLRPFAEELGF